MNNVLEHAARARGCTTPKIKYLADDLDVTYQSVQKWIERGYMPIDRAIQVEEKYGLCRLSVMDPKVVDAVMGAMSC